MNTHKITWFLAWMITLPTVLADVSDGDHYGCGFGGMMYSGYGTGSIFLNWVIGLLVIVALVLLIVWLLKQINKTGGKKK